MLLRDMKWEVQGNGVERARVPMTEHRQLVVWREATDAKRHQVQVVRRNTYLHNHWPVDALEAQCLIYYYLRGNDAR